MQGNGLGDRGIVSNLQKVLRLPCPALSTILLNTRHHFHRQQNAQRRVVMSEKSRMQSGASNEEIGHGGEVHQVAGGTYPPLTTQTGAIIADDENSLRGGERGPTLLEDHLFLEKLQHFDH